MNQIKSVSIAAASLAVFLFALPVFSAGTSARGWLLVQKIKKLESRGVMFDSWEGTFSVISFDKKEECSEKENQCFTPVEKDILFSVRSSNAEAVEALNKFMEGGSFLIEYRRHRMEPIKLSTKFEVLQVKARKPSLPDGVERRKSVKKTGSRNFSIKGQVLQLDRQGCLFRTYEGLYFDAKNGKVHPFSVTDKGMAAHIFSVMEAKPDYNIGISDAIIKGMRKSDYDVYEINFDRSALGLPGVSEEKAEPASEKESE